MSPRTELAGELRGRSGKTLRVILSEELKRPLSGTADEIMLLDVEAALEEIELDRLISQVKLQIATLRKGGDHDRANTLQTELNIALARYAQELKDLES